MNQSLAYLDWGRWVAQCPSCTDATTVYRQLAENGPIVRQASATCVNGHTFLIVMPGLDDEQAIVAAVAARPEAQRAWYPDGLPLAADAGLPTGQSATELQAETDAMVTGDQQVVVEERDDALRTALAAAGITVNPDGTFTGQL